ncbi:hypothetical protein GCM10009558_015080 [Virgisporangium aurantiacum]
MLMVGATTAAMLVVLFVCMAPVAGVKPPVGQGGAGGNADGCTAAFNRANFFLARWDPDPAKRDQTRDESAVPGPVPETYNNRGQMVPYLRYMQTAQEQYGVPWYLLAAISWQETRHGADPDTWNRNQSSDHSYGPMQFIPATWKEYGVDGDGDGRISDESVGDQIHTTASMLKRTRVLEGLLGFNSAIGRYNPRDTYRNDILFWASKYDTNKALEDSGIVCDGSDSVLLQKVTGFALKQVGRPYVWGAEGPDAFDCSGLMYAAFQTVGITVARVAADQADDEQIQIVKRRPVTGPDGLMPGDMLFIDNGDHDPIRYSTRLQAHIGHVAMYIGGGEVVEAHSTGRGVIRSTYSPSRWATVMGVGRVKGILAAGGPDGTWARPVDNAVVTSNFGLRIHPVTKERKMHNGIDLGAGCGTPINAVADGVVIFASDNVGGYGQYIVIDHGQSFHTGYGHQQAMYVSAGQPVQRGQHIADVGDKGDATGHCHLHFNTLTGAVADPWAGNYVDPKPLLVKHGVSYWS